MKRSSRGSLGCAFVLWSGVYAGCAAEGGDVVARLDGGPPQAPGLVPPPPDADAGEAGIDKVLSCVATECPAPWATCLRGDGTIPYTCETNLLTDDNNCGGC